VVGLPANAATRKGVVLGYRIIGTIRGRAVVAASRPRWRHAEGEPGHRRDLDPQHREYGRPSGRPRDGAKRRRLADPFGSGPSDPAGKSVSIPLGTKLAAGRYTVALRLTQRGKVALSGTKRFTVKR
jgi:hypothetical protein